MNLIVVLLSPILVLIVYVGCRLLSFVVYYFTHRPAFDKLPRLTSGFLINIFAPDFHVKFPEILVNTFPTGIPPLIFGGPSFDGAPLVIVNEPAAIRTVCDDVLFPKATSYDMVAVFIGNGLVSSKGDVWQQKRNLINPWFHAAKLKDMIEGMTTNGVHMVEKLKLKKGVAVDVVEIMGEVTQKVLIDSMFSGKIDATWLHHIWAAVNDALNPYILGGLVLGFNLNNLKIWPWTRKVLATRAVIQVKINELVEKAHKGNQEGDFVEYLVANGFSAEAIFEESMTMLFAGHDTTKNTLSWLTYFLGENPSILQRLQQEVDTELKGAIPTFNDINKLHHCKNALLETLRMRPPAASLDRVVAQNTILCGTPVPKGTALTIHLHGIMMDPKYWQNPFTFNPDRFDEDTQYTHHFMPFSYGARNCIGQKFAIQEGILLAAMLVQNFDIIHCKEYQVKAVFAGTLMPKGLHCKFIERKKQNN